MRALVAAAGAAGGGGGCVIAGCRSVRRGLRGVLLLLAPIRLPDAAAVRDGAPRIGDMALPHNTCCDGPAGDNADGECCC